MNVFVYQAKAERQRLHDESRAFEVKQREEQRAEQVLRIAAVCISNAIVYMG